jgi:glycosyltransferase involved in cell wall biosynthesis
MNNKNAVITRDFSALPELVKDKGILIPEKILNEDLIKHCVLNTLDLLKNDEKLLQMQEDLYLESLKYDWKKIGKKLKTIID